MKTIKTRNLKTNKTHKNNNNNNNNIQEQTVSSDYGKTFEQLVIENENFVYSIVNNEFKQYPWNIKEELYSAGKERISVCCH